MTVAYPFLQILVFLSLLLAPPDADRIFIDGAGAAVVLRRDGANWTMTQNGQISTVSIAGDTLVTLRDGKEERLPLAEYVGPTLRHDWTASPKLVLPDATTLEKDAAGRLLADTGAIPPKRHVVQFAKPGEIRVHVIGSANNPGSYILPAGATLLDAIAAAGGRNRVSMRNQVRLRRCPDGEKIETTVVNPQTLDKEQNKGPVLQDGDIIEVPEIVC